MIANALARRLRRSGFEANAAHRDVKKARRKKVSSKQSAVK
jgi:hypothetical protein